MKPLYLKGEQPLTVRLDGPALRVSREGVSCQRFPLTRISRITVSGETDWNTRALLACADAGISICFLDGGGELRARFMGRSPAAGALARLWSNFLDRPDHQVLLAEWRENTRRRAIGLCALRMGIASATLLMRADCFIPVPNTEQRELEDFMRRLDGLIESRLVFELSRHGMHCDDVDLLDLTPELVLIAQWALRPDLANWWRGRNRRRIRIDPVVAFLEKFKGTVDFQLRDALHGLYRFLLRFD